MTTDDDPDRVSTVVQRVEQGQIAFAGTAEDGFDAKDAQLIGQNLAAAARLKG